MTSQDYEEILKGVRKNFRNGVIKSLESRLNQLKQMFAMLENEQEAIYGALQKDLHKNQCESNLGELLLTKIEIGTAINNLSSWMKPEKVKADLINKMNTCQIHKEALGVVLIIGAWNFPISIILTPLIGAIAAGNCAILKPSEMSEHSAQLLVEIIPKYMDQDCIRVITGGIPETSALLRLRFDHIFYTGSTNVGKIVMKAAAEHLTPVTLELGGKCPAIVDNTCNFDVIGQRIAWGRYMNSGQACLCVDYVICLGEGVQEKLVNSIKKAVVNFYGEDPQQSDSYGRIVNKRHFQRVSKMINTDKVVFGGKIDEADLYISPTIMTDVTPDDDVMGEEIFGPLLPIMTMKSVDEAIDFINDREKPLAVYVFTTDYNMSNKVSDNTSSGGFVCNDAFVHYALHTLPFGGIGSSGMGAYHGKFSFDTFSHKKAIISKNQALESLNDVRYPPYSNTSKMYQWAEWALKPTVRR